MYRLHGIGTLVDDTPSNGGTSWTLYAILAVVGILGLAAIGGGGPRRYGR